MGEIERLSEVQLEYRKLSDVRFNDNQFLIWTNASLNLLDGVENTEKGITSLDWTVPEVDAAYELRLKSVCRPLVSNGSPQLNSFTSSSIVGLIDRSPPSIVGKPLPPVNLHPGSTLRLEFSESGECELPYQFSITVDVSEIDEVYTMDGDLHINFFERYIEVQFNENRAPSGSYTGLLGRLYNITVRGVGDKTGNVLQEYIYQSNFAC